MDSITLKPNRKQEEQAKKMESIEDDMDRSEARHS